MTNQHTIAYIDCFSGISGDMFLGALLDAGVPENELRRQLALLDLAGYTLSATKKSCGSIAATALTIETEENHPHRSWGEIRQLISTSELAKPVQETALSIFSLLAEAEAKVHGRPVDTVHFHEVGGIDSIIDIVGAAIGLEVLKITGLQCAPLPMPHGWVQCAHGRLPLPAPAVCELLQGVPTYGVELNQELVTPTGAAIVKALASHYGPMPAMTMAGVGYGAGSQELSNGQPNLLRLILGTTRIMAEAQEVEVIETHLDDWSPETFPYLSEQLFGLGALDVALIPIQMKKGRPGFLLRVICDRASALPAKECILSETTAIGLRFRTEQRWTLPRENGTVPTRWGAVRVKKVTTPAGEVLTPEYEDCKRVAIAHGVPLKAVYGEVARSQHREFKGDT
ncbi:nickel pincer cofactor biosynthesis protein LarC [Thiovibrio frasassiensis]|uniref:Putative nickel insertion protein n=1 Tax=Thiovibrio frasassiensis TaxID=2984131 RepID=A0A9X4MED0_9BACT|nr:nickel pincer cofactor biosynthesis protein LarC [Thiovibrio frasassiensis]MDG4476009.1 nickel pincer cofactor biosynthesis protein LarC [Thiovibrio frasassiensis]